MLVLDTGTRLCLLSGFADSVTAAVSASAIELITVLGQRHVLHTTEEHTGLRELVSTLCESHSPTHTEMLGDSTGSIEEILRDPLFHSTITTLYILTLA